MSSSSCPTSIALTSPSKSMVAGIGMNHTMLPVAFVTKKTLRNEVVPLCLKPMRTPGCLE